MRTVAPTSEDDDYDDSSSELAPPKEARGRGRSGVSGRRGRSGVSVCVVMLVCWYA